MTPFQAITLGITQGLTEFLPISSIAHLRIVPALLGWEDPGAAFSAVIQLGTLLAVVIYFREDLRRLLWAIAKSPRERQKSDDIHARLSWSILYGTFPIVVFGVLFKEAVTGPFIRSLQVISGSLILLAIVMVIAESRGQQKKGLEDLSLGGAFFIGCAQALALIPGMSRSGTTITAGLFTGLTSAASARFSFLLGSPAILLAGIFELKDLLEAGLGNEGLFSLLLGITFAFVSGYFAIDFLLRYLQTHSLRLFIVYRILLGVLLLVLASLGLIS
ncbi:MAG: undecaprenyl-diphosphatase UppP [candidate division NC10 bacterium]|nr:undecaprenyl-diphosphatase UppP [candidate division NC10 bacterium]